MLERYADGYDEESLLKCTLNVTGMTFKQGIGSIYERAVEEMERDPPDGKNRIGLMN